MATRREKIEQMLHKEPRDAFLNFSLAMEMVKEGKTDLALSQFDRVLEVDGEYLAAHFQKGNTLLALRRLDDAREALRAGIRAARSVGDSHAVGEMQEVLDGIA